jgi:hypothetical protein
LVGAEEDVSAKLFQAERFDLLLQFIGHAFGYN